MKRAFRRCLVFYKRLSTNYRRDCLAFAACFPSARRAFFGSFFRVCLGLAAPAAFLILLRAAVRCFLLPNSVPFPISCSVPHYLRHLVATLFSCTPVHTVLLPA